MKVFYTLLFLLFILSLILIFVCYIKIFYYESKINKLHIEKEVEIKSKEGKGRGIPLDHIKAQQKKIASYYDQQIETLERKRRFVLDKVPFVTFFK